MKQDAFIKKYQANWDQFAAWLDYQAASKAQKAKLTQPAIDMPKTYRQICHHLSLAQTRLYSPHLIERLNHLVIRGHQALYQSRPPVLQHIIFFLVAGFPQLVRQHWRLLSLSAALFYIPFVALIITAQINPDIVHSVLSPQQIVSLESMYNPELNERVGREREADSDVYMFGFYIRNNTGIGFQTFAGGLLFGAGTVFTLLFNGVFLGAAAGHLTQLGYIETFWGFVSGHSAMELTAIIIAGTSGLKIAAALIAPRRKTRSRALLDNSKIAVKLIYGAALMFIFAAFIEAFWSSLAMIPVIIKYIVGLSFWVLVISYFSFAGRQHYAA
ncbi:MAG: stage II sporulation protein M [bacterium]